jgi:hypothetical protein
MRTSPCSAVLFLLSSIAATGCRATPLEAPPSSAPALLEGPSAPPPTEQEGDDAPGPDAFDSHQSTAHFQVSYHRAESSAEEVAAVTGRLEPLWEGLATWVGNARLPSVRIEILLEGEGMKEGEAPKFPHVGSLGRVHLYRYAGGESGAYERQLEHEVIHATRNLIGLHDLHVTDRTTGFGFVEEGFAEMLAREIAPAQSGFPVFGHTFDVAVGAWLSSGDAIPIPTLMRRHDLNARCMVQAYPLRASFMKYLDATYGRESLLALAYGAAPVDASRYTSLFGHTPERLATDWESWARARFAAVPNAAEAAASYRASPAQFFPACRPGTDF